MRLRRWLNSSLRYNTSSKGVIVFLIFFCIYTLWLRYSDDETVSEEMTDEALQNVAHDLRYAEVYRKKTHLPKGLKYILLWTDPTFAPFYYMGKGQKGLIEKNCSIINCYVTSNRRFFANLTQFDAIAFNGRNLKYLSTLDFPSSRSPHQKYIYVNTESSRNYPVCDSNYEGFFNWTATYKLDSDIVFPYLLIRNAKGETVGPKKNMNWVVDDKEVDREYERKLRRKTRAVAWFVSNCVSQSGREQFVSKLWYELAEYNLTVDVYGDCGPLKCPRYKEDVCNRMLERRYYFYLSLENSIADDYVTEKLLTALQHDVVPIVYGGADYSRFLPPGSYIDARAFNVKQLARLLNRLMRSPELYVQYFRWKRHYFYHRYNDKYICALCEALNNKSLVERYSSYENFREWWNMKDLNQCKPWLQRILTF